VMYVIPPERAFSAKTNTSMNNELVSKKITILD
jgi:hypothetical protein